MPSPVLHVSPGSRPLPVTMYEVYMCLENLGREESHLRKGRMVARERLAAVNGPAPAEVQRTRHERASCRHVPGAGMEKKARGNGQRRSS
ncbi:hypothetical protein F751_6197 [Auxenochlorella protothecoides]|uniref:Uncharacterized protein n=1 Tax=Auxenochlorella protothecoides TaxID=3075 RepID=A0A087SJZ2_AUXPR|nr:hypothetical protein F751_6197 [Auxenochlorella protothecoides]KFM26046.1 hypothetical protein F751_6197 [Auxenochlorella protothecoides]